MHRIIRDRCGSKCEYFDEKEGSRKLHRCSDPEVVPVRLEWSLGAVFVLLINSDDTVYLVCVFITERRAQERMRRRQNP
jgi:hypothetical protein